MRAVNGIDDGVRVINVLGQIPLFRDLAPELPATVAAEVSARHAPADTVLFEMEDDGNDMFGALKAASLLHKLWEIDYERWLGAAEAWHMATAAGATAVTRSSISVSRRPLSAVLPPPLKRTARGNPRFANADRRSIKSSNGTTRMPIR